MLVLTDTFSPKTQRVLKAIFRSFKGLEEPSALVALSLRTKPRVSRNHTIKGFEQTLGLREGALKALPPWRSRYVTTNQLNNLIANCILFTICRTDNVPESAHFYFSEETIQKTLVFGQKLRDEKFFS